MDPRRDDQLGAGRFRSGFGNPVAASGVGEIDFPAAAFRRQIDRRLNGVGVIGDPVAFGAEFENIDPACEISFHLLSF